MEIKFNHEITSAPRAEFHGRTARPAEPQADRPSFEASERINEAFAAVPDVRPEAVERGKNLASLVQYPPAETMRKLAILLAMDIENNS